MPMTRPGQRVEDEHARASRRRRRRSRAAPRCRAAGHGRRHARSRRSAAMSTSSMHRRDHDGGERRLGQLLEQAGQEQQRHDGQHGDDEPGDLALGPGAAVDGRLREAAVDHHAARQARSEVRGAEAEQLAVGVDLVVVPGGVGLGRAQALREADQHDADGAAGELEVLLGADVRAARATAGRRRCRPTISTPCSSRSNA